MKTATSAVLVGTSHKAVPCPVTGQEVSTIYQCFPTGRFVRASSEQAALESHNASSISNPESTSQKPEPTLVQATLAFWETTKNNSTKQ